MDRRLVAAQALERVLKQVRVRVDEPREDEPVAAVEHGRAAIGPQDLGARPDGHDRAALHDQGVVLQDADVQSIVTALMVFLTINEASSIRTFLS